MISVAIDITEELGARAAGSLLGHPSVELIGCVGRKPPKSWGRRAREVSDATGFDVAIGLDGAAVRVHRFAPPDSGGVGWASAVGLARSLGARMEDVEAVAVTVPGAPLGAGRRFGFPPPIGWAAGAPTDRGFWECPVEGSYAGALALDRTGHSIATSDDGLFLTAACLAAGVIVAVPGCSAVWERAEDYLEACELFGIVVAAG